LEFDGGFSWDPQASSLILRIVGFASLKIIGFDPFKAKVGDIAITIIHDDFFSKAAIWLKTRVGFDGRQWVLIQCNESHFYFTSPWPFDSA
jgi:hypothetical protein